MHVTQISDRQTFLDKAAVNSVTCTLAGEVVPEPRPDGSIWMVPVMRLYYSMDLSFNPIEDLSHPLALGTRWTFIETKKAVNNQVTLEGTLLQTLQSDARYNVAVETRGPR